MQQEQQSAGTLTMNLSIIIPMLNEAALLPDCLTHLRPLQQSGIEVIVVDGGSHDGSDRIARQAGFTVRYSKRGRARQMNCGAATASGDILLFLHADTRLPGEVTAHLDQALSGGQHVWGRFDVNICGHAWQLRLVAALMNLRSRLSGIATGDQAMFMTQAAFTAVGGFPEQPLMEDIEMSRRLLSLSRPACIGQRATTSGRRWETQGVWRTIMLMWRLRWAYWRGTPADRLERFYQ